MKALGYSIAGLFFIACFASPFVLLILAFTGLHVETSKGEHTGFITAVETNGLFFKTDSAYVKTDTQSSQEDQYCVVNPEVFAQLKAASEKKEHVTISYISWFAAGVAYCKGEDAVITGVTPSK